MWHLDIKSLSLNTAHCADEYVQKRRFDMDEWGFPFITMLLLFSKKSEQKCQSSYFSVLCSMLLGYSLRSYDVSFDNSHFIWETRGVHDQKKLFSFQFAIPAPMPQSMAISDQNGTTIQSRSQLEWSTVIGFGVSGPERSTAAVLFSFLYHFILLCSITSLEDSVCDSSVPFICCLLPSANLFSIASWSKEHQRLTSTGYKTSSFFFLFFWGFSQGLRQKHQTRIGRAVRALSEQGRVKKVMNESFAVKHNDSRSLAVLTDREPILHNSNTHTVQPLIFCQGKLSFETLT